MKLKNIFLSLLMFAAFASCSEEEIVGPDNGNGKDKGQPAVLMINGSAGENLETKSDDAKKPDKDEDKPNEGDVLYVFVYDESGLFLGKGSSDERLDEKADKVADVLYSQTFTDPLNSWNNDGSGGDKKGREKITEDIKKTSPNDVIVSGEGIVSGKNVDIILIANPTDAIKELYETNADRVTLSEALTTLEEQVELYENGGHSTACQRLKITDLKRGINYCGKNKYASQNETGNSGSQKRDWWTAQYKDQIPLYRLISEIRLTVLAVDPPSIRIAGFVLTKAYLKGNTYSSQSHLFPEEYPAHDNWCQSIKGVKSPDESRNLVLVGKEVGAMNKPLFGIFVSTGTDVSIPAEYDKHCSVIIKDLTYRPIVSKPLKLREATQSLYSFEDSAPVLVIEGYFRWDASDANTVMLKDKRKYVKYEVKIKNAEKEEFQRNHIYNVKVTITGEGSSAEGGDIEEGVGIEANIEIANMAEANPNFTFGE